MSYITIFTRKTCTFDELKIELKIPFNCEYIINKSIHDIIINKSDLSLKVFSY